jgi:hypothetical protein
MSLRIADSQNGDQPLVRAAGVTAWAPAALAARARRADTGDSAEEPVPVPTPLVLPSPHDPGRRQASCWLRPAGAHPDAHPPIALPHH